MLYELEYDLDTQIVVNSFVNDDYKEMSNAKVGHYLGYPENPFAKKQENDTVEEAKKDFSKWMQ